MPTLAFCWDLFHCDDWLNICWSWVTLALSCGFWQNGGRIRDWTKRPFFSLRLLYNATDALQGITTPARHAHILLAGPPSPSEFMWLLHFAVLSPTFLPHLHRRKKLGSGPTRACGFNQIIYITFDKMIKGHCFRPREAMRSRKRWMETCQKGQKKSFLSSVAINFTMWLIKLAKNRSSGGRPQM